MYGNMYQKGPSVGCAEPERASRQNINRLVINKEGQRGHAILGSQSRRG